MLSSLRLDPSSETPLTLQLADAIVTGIRAGVLRAGDRLPGQRSLAVQLGVSRTTVVRAYDELESQGWSEAREGAGTFIATSLPAAPGVAPTGAMSDRTAFPLVPPGATAQARWLPPGDLVANLAGGTPDLRTIPLEDITRAWRRAVRSQGRSLLGYGPAAGHPALREAVAAWLRSTRGLRCGPEEVLIARGAQMSAYLTLRTLLRPGDVVAVEALGYEPIWAVLRMCGATIVPIPVDGDGLDVEALADLCSRTRLRAVYVTPHHQFPTMAVLSASRRIQLLNLAREHGFAVLEDDYDHEFHYDARPVLPVASMDTAGCVVYVGSLSKVVAPGLRIGYVVAPRPFIDSLAQLRTIVDRQGDVPMEAAVAELLVDGSIQRHIGRARRLYRGRRDLFVELLREHLPTLEFEVPSGGLSLWAGTDEDAAQWERAARARGVWMHAGWRFAQAGTEANALRLGWASANEAELIAGVRVLAKVRPSAPAR